MISCEWKLRDERSGMDGKESFMRGVKGKDTQRGPKKGKKRRGGGRREIRRDKWRRKGAKRRDV